MMCCAILRPHLEERGPIWRKGTPFGEKKPHLEERDPLWRKETPFGGKGPHLEERDPIWRKGAPFEAITGRTASPSDGFLAEVFGVKMQLSLKWYLK